MGRRSGFSNKRSVSVRAVLFFALITPVVAKIILGMVCYFLSGLVSEDVLYPSGGFLSDAPVWVSAITVIIVIPVIEELLFRLLLFKWLLCTGLSIPVLLAVIISSFAFALFHMNLYQGLYAFFVGVYLACLFARSGRLRYPLLFHCVANAQSLLIEFVLSYTM